jgi:hypothetical protein
MKTTIALIIEPSDLTKDGNVKREAFEAIAKHDLVIHDGRIFKWSPASTPCAPQEPVRRARRARAPQPPQTPPQAITEHADDTSTLPPFADAS